MPARTPLRLAPVLRALPLAVLAPLLIEAAAADRSGPALRGAGGTFVINEVDYDQPGTDQAEFVELYNVAAVALSLDGYVLEFVNGSGGGAVVYDTIELPDVTVAPGGFFVVCANGATVPNCDLDGTPDMNFIQNGAPDAIGLRFQGTRSGEGGDVLVDAVSYEGNTGAPYTETAGVGVDDSPSVSFAGISRFPDGHDTDDNSSDFAQRCATPGVANVNTAADCADPNQPVLSCTDAYLFIASYGTVETDEHFALEQDFAVARQGGDPAMDVDLSGCSYALFDPYTALVTYSGALTGTVAAFDNYLVAQTGYTGAGAPDQTFAAGAVPDGPGAFAVLEGPAPTVGVAAADVAGDVVAAIVYYDAGNAFGACGGFVAPCAASGASASEARPFPEMLAGVVGAVSADAGAGATPTAVSVSDVYPNPARGAFAVRFGLPASGEARVALYDVLGREVAVLHAGPTGAGWHRVDADPALPAGVYLVRIVAGAGASARALTVIR